MLPVAFHSLFLWLCCLSLLSPVWTSVREAAASSPPAAEAAQQQRKLVRNRDAPLGRQFINPEEYDITPRYKSRPDEFASQYPDLLGVVQDAKMQMKQLLDDDLHVAARSPIANRLASIIVFTFPLQAPLTEKSVQRLSYLHCSISRLYKHIAPWTPLDVFLFVDHESLVYLPAWMREEFPRLVVLPIPPRSFAVPADFSPQVLWKYPHYSEDYHMMGRWRTAFGMAFVRSLGYGYVLQLDDDTFVLDEMPYDIVASMAAEEKVMAVKGKMVRENNELMKGAPELMRYFMATRGITHPIGPLYTVVPHRNSSGVSSEAWEVKLIYCACFMVLSVDFWFEDVVQDFVQLVHRTRSDVEQRWLEQGIQNMVRWMLVPDGNLHVITHSVQHGKPLPALLPSMGCSRTHKVLRNDVYGDMSRYLTPTTWIYLFFMRESNRDIANFDWNCSTTYDALTQNGWNMTGSECDTLDGRTANFRTYARRFCDFIGAAEEMCDQLAAVMHDKWSATTGNQQVDAAATVVPTRGAGGGDAAVGAGADAGTSARTGAGASGGTDADVDPDAAIVSGGGGDRGVDGLDSAKPKPL